VYDRRWLIIWLRGIDSRGILRHWFIWNLLCCLSNRQWLLFGFTDLNLLPSGLFNLFLVDDFLFFYFVLPFLLFSLTHFDDPLHDLFFLLIYLVFLFLLFSQWHLHCLFHQLFLRPLFSFNHLLCNFNLLRLLSCCLWHRVLARLRCLFLAWLRLLLLSLATTEHLDRLFVQFCVTLDHESLESDEVVDGSNLINDLFMERVSRCFLTSHQELVLGHSQLCHQLWEQVIHCLFELLYDCF
jgi:hypothetical protein